MKKISLILLSLFLLQGTETCQAKPYKSNSDLAKEKNKPQPPQPSPNEDEEREKKEKLELEEKKKLEELEEKKKLEELEEKKKLEELAAKVELEKAAETEKKMRSELEKEFSALKIENDLKDTELAAHKTGKRLPKELEEKISDMGIDKFYQKKKINKLIRESLNSERSPEMSNDKYQKALKLLGIPDNDSGLNDLREQKARHTKELAALKAKNSAQDIIALEAKDFALRRVLSALEKVADKDFSIEVLIQAARDSSVPQEIQTMFNQTLANIKPWKDSNDAETHVKVKRALQPLGIAAQKALENVAKELDDTNKSTQKAEGIEKLISKLTELEEHLATKIFKLKSGTRTKNFNTTKNKRKAYPA